MFCDIVWVNCCFAFSVIIGINWSIDSNSSSLTQLVGAMLDLIPLQRIGAGSADNTYVEVCRRIELLLHFYSLVTGKLRRKSVGE